MYKLLKEILKFSAAAKSLIQVYIFVTIRKMFSYGAKKGRCVPSGVMVQSGFQMERESFLSEWVVGWNSEEGLTKMVDLHEVMESAGLSEEGRIYPILTNVS